MRIVSVLIAALALSAAAAAQGLTLLEGATVNALDVVVLDETDPAGSGTVLLQGIELMPIEIAGRSATMELQTDRARRIVRNGLPRIELPGGGRLFQYRRASGQFWGYLLVPPD